VNSSLGSEKMKIYGYSSKEKINDDGLLEMKEITIQTKTNYLREVSTFLNQCADSIEKHGDKFGHGHFSDYLSNWDKKLSDIIVVKK
jgi:hypothetical protein